MIGTGHQASDLRLFTADEYQRLAETGILGPDERVELIDGQILKMSPVGPLHSDVVSDLTFMLATAFCNRGRVRVQSPVRLSDRSEPEPDVAVVQPRRYRSVLPTPVDIILLIEVSDNTIRLDRNMKLPLYACSGIREYWIVDLNGGTIEVYRSPLNGTYPPPRIVVSGDGLNIAGLPPPLVSDLPAACPRCVKLGWS